MTDPLLDLMRPQSTGGRIVTFKPGVTPPEEEEALRHAAGGGLHTLSALELRPCEAEDPFAVMLLEDTGLAYLPCKWDASEMSVVTERLLSDDRVAEVRPEFYLHAFETFADRADATWGLLATGVLDSPFTGRGVKLAVLDTGFDFGHPDFAGREITSQSFVEGETADDVQGHGTHCAGTAAGGRAGASGLRYGVAPDALLHVGKALDNSGSGRERDVQASVVWAIRSGCAVISMSLGRPVRPGEPHEPDYERLGEFALASGALILAAAGNDSGRKFGHIAPVGSPANAPSILAVGALDQALDVAEFSGGGINPAGGEVDLAAPGVGVLSSVPRPQLYASLRGTSMACPHAAGVAALWAESDPGLRGRALWDRLTASARPLSAPRRDVGAGLVRAPFDETGLMT
jgi:subtilisin family serine protease